MNFWASNFFSANFWKSEFFQGGGVVPPTPSVHPTKFISAEPRGTGVQSSGRLTGIQAVGRVSSIQAEGR